MPRLLALLLIFSACVAQAETSDDAQEELSGTLSELKTTSQKHKELEKKRSVLEQEMKTLQQETVDMARDTKEQEEALMALEEKNAILESQKKDKKAALDARRAELSETLAAMVKLGKMPPEAVIAMPGKVHETLSAARALKVITKAVEDESTSLKAQLHELDELQKKIGKNREALVHKKAELINQQTLLTAKINARGKVHTALNGKAQQEKERIQHLTEKSKSLQDLVDTLGRTEKTEDKSEEQETASTPATKVPAPPTDKTHKGRAFAQSKGKLGLPVAGKIIGLYGHSEGGAAFSKGMMIETHSAGNVVAPYDGQVVYAGVFRDYGKMVIIRHKGDYHTLLSGMEQINCAVGQFLLEGEPIGAMGKPSDGGNPKLYVEMRKSGKPIDPMSWFKG